MDYYDRTFSINSNDHTRNNKRNISKNIERSNEVIENFNGSLTIKDDLNIKKIKEEIKTELKKKPKIKIKFLNTSFIFNRWEKTKMEIVNEGDVIGKGIEFMFSDDITVRNLSKIEIKPGDRKIIEFNLKPNALGEIPLEVKIKYKDHLNRKHRFKKIITIEVKERTEEIHEKDIYSAESTLKPTTSKTFPPELLDRYSEVEFMGEGGLAKVFKAKHKDGKKVAIKIPISLDESVRKFFLKEIDNWIKLNHRNIVKVYDYNILPIPYFEMELCDKSLADLKKPLDPEKAAWIIFYTAEGLIYAHSKKIIHSDLKPHNILLKNGIPKICDWGLSKNMAKSTSTIDKGFTPLYVSPEQISDESKDERTDIWQLGVIFYELITGELPFKGDSLVEIVMAIITKDPIPPSRINPKSKEVEKIIMKCLEKDKTKRYQSVRELQRDLSNYLGIKYKETLMLNINKNDFKRSIHQSCEFFLLNMKINNIINAYKHVSDLLNYTEGDVKQEVKELHKCLEYKIEDMIKDISEEVIKKEDQ